MEEEKLLGIKTHIAEIIGIDSKNIEYKKDFDTDIHAFKFYIENVKKKIKITDETIKDYSLALILQKLSLSTSKIKNDDEITVTTGS